MGRGEFAEAAQSRSDAELLAAHVAGDRYAFEELVLRHHSQLRRLAYLTSNHLDDVDDVVQEALLKAHRTAATFRFDSAVSSWLHRIVVNTCLDRLRRARSRPSATHYVELGHVDHLRDPAGDPAPRVAAAIVVERALLQLPVDQRAAVVAVDMQGYSVAETARLLGVAEGTVKSRCARARAKLARTLQYFDGDEPQPATSAYRGADHP
ncbi:RNA polymerase sigma factor SigM [Mycobacterium sp. SWH-M5]|nr:RNA polymerase sigma factor SigM [Mycobacterium sp. SWH-M5]